MIWGGRVSLIVGILPTLLAMMISLFFGIAAAFKGGLIDTLIMRTLDVFFAFPLVLLAIAIAGVIGGNNSSVNAKTTRIWLEAAVFTPTSVRNSSREIGLRTDSSSRYEKGISPNMTTAVSLRASDLISLELGGNVQSTHVNKEFIRKKL